MNTEESNFEYNNPREQTMPSSGVSNNLKYFSFQIAEAMLIIPCTSSWYIVNLTWPSIQNANNMDLDAATSARYLSLVTSSYFAGAVTGCILS